MLINFITTAKVKRAVESERRETLRRVVAFVLATIRTGKEYDVVEEVRKIEGVKEVFITYGVWDALIRVEVSSLSELDKVVTQIRGVEGVEYTTTLVGV